MNKYNFNDTISTKKHLRVIYNATALENADGMGPR